MTLRPLDATLSVSPQIALSDLATLHAQGFRSVISNRPDGEEPGQPSAAEVAAAAAAAGLEFRHIPVRPGEANPAAARDMAAALASLPGPVLAFCKSGGRSAALYAASRQG